MSESIQKAPCDLAQLDCSAVAERQFPQPGARSAGNQVVIRQSVLNQIYAHGKATPNVEICGVLVGNVYRDRDGGFVYVEARIKGEHAGSELAQVTFTAATWRHVQEELERDFPHLRILGWYHTHPGFGIFLSKMDRFIHDNFFNAPEQLAFVFDPRSNEEGMFVWRKGAPQRETIVIEPDEPRRLEALPGQQFLPVAAAASIAAPKGAGIERQIAWLWRSIAVLTLFAAAWPFAILWAFRGKPFTPPSGWAEPPSSHSRGRGKLPLNAPRRAEPDATAPQPAASVPEAPSVPVDRPTAPVGPPRLTPSAPAARPVGPTVEPPRPAPKPAVEQPATSTPEAPAAPAIEAGPSSSNPKQSGSVQP